MPTRELVRIVKQGRLRPGRTLEVGCGTGADAIFLARRGFEVTAVDSSPTAIERARRRLELEGVVARFVLADAFEFARSAGKFDLVYDAGFYEFVRQTDLGQHLDMLWRVTRPGSWYLALTGNAGGTAGVGPPPLTKEEIYDELGRLFELVRLRTCKFESPHRKQGYLGWSCLMQRPELRG